MPNQQTVAILCGGVSPEHEVSMNSARNIYKAIDKEKYRVEVIGVSRIGAWYHLPVADFMEMTAVEDPSGEQLVLAPGQARTLAYRSAKAEFPHVDVVFPIIHGPFGEDGTMQGLLSVLGLPFVGPGTLGSAVGMDKDVTKRLLRDAGIAVAPWVTLYQHEQPDYAAITREHGFPLFVKPANMGSSVGVSKATDEASLRAAVELAFRFDVKILVEKGIVGREIETAVLGNLEDADASGVGEIVMERGFYDYESKYISADAAKVVVPADDIFPEAVEKIRQTALKAYRALALEGLSRMDVFLCPDGTVYVNEPNTLPGFTNISMYPKLWEAAGISYAELIDRLLSLALARHRRDGALQRTRIA